MQCVLPTGRRVDRLSRIGSHARIEHRHSYRPAMQAAFFVLGLLPPPASRPNVFARLDGAGARRAADAREPRGMERIGRHIVAPDIAPDVVFTPVSERIELGEPV